MKSWIWLVIGGFALLYIGGWHVFATNYLPGWSNLGGLWIGQGIAIEFNYVAYGIGFYSRFFHSTIISWLLMGGAGYLLGGAAGGIMRDLEEWVEEDEDTSNIKEEK